jgi:hypothetical protein
VPTEPEPLSLSTVADRAADVVDPTGVNDGVAYIVERLQDRDEPVAGVLPGLDEQLAEVVGRVDPQEEDPAVMMMSVVMLHLAHRRDELDAEPVRILEQAARNEYHGKPPELVADWLAGQGVAD